MGWRRNLQRFIETCGAHVRRFEPLRFDAFTAQQILFPGARTIFDVGANVGDTTEFYLEKWPAAKVYGFEPQKAVGEKYLARFNGNRRVSLQSFALGESSQPMTFHVTEQHYCASLLERPQTGNTVHQSAVLEEITIDVTTLDDFCELHDVRPDLLKLDVEGYERNVVRGGESLLSSGAVKLVYSEVNFTPQHFGTTLFYELTAQLAEHDFRLFNIYNQRFAKSGRLWYGDAIFLHSSLDVGDRVAADA